MRVIAFLLITVLPSLGAAQSLFSMETTDSGRQWDAVGRLEISGRAFCTGALIAPDLVLTAAHCLYNPETLTRVDVEEIQFLAGWRNGRAAAYRRVKQAVAHPDYDFSAPPLPERVRNDVALIRLQHPIRNTTIAPFETDRSPAVGDTLGVVSYAYNRSEAPSLQETCAVLSRQDGVLVMSCAVDFGSSGSPVFVLVGDRPRIVSVISAMAEAGGKPVSLGTSLDGPLAVIMAQIDHDDIRNSLSAGTRKNTGAKFIKP